MYRWNSRGYNNTNSVRSTSNLSEFSFSTTSVISAQTWIWNVFKTFFSLLSIFQCRRILRKVNPINYSCTCTRPHLISCSSSTSCQSCSFYSKSKTPKNNTLKTNSCDSISSSKTNNCNNISDPQEDKEENQPKSHRKMAQILSKTMTLLGIAFLIHFIIISTFAEKSGYSHGYHSNGEGSHATRRQRSYRSEKHMLSPDENTLAPIRYHNKSEAMFFTENSTIIVAQIGSKTYLPCAVRNLGSGVASWIRRKDYTLLTVGMGTYSNDDRFVVSHNRAAQSWELHIKMVKEFDEGIYECQISSHPPSSIFIHLSVVEAKAEILGEPDKHVRSGSTFELVCVLRDSTEPPVYVFWYHNHRMINYDNVRGVVVNSDTEKSILTIQDAQKTDSGNYTCVPSNARPTSISVHILNGEKPAAMQHGSRSDSGRQLESSLGLLFVSTVAVFLMTGWLLTTNLIRQQNIRNVPKGKGKEDALANPNLQIVSTSEKEKWDLQLQIESAYTDNDKQIQKRFFLESLILLLSQLCVPEISYQSHQLQNQNCNQKTDTNLSRHVFNISKSKSQSENISSSSSSPRKTLAGVNPYRVSHITKLDFSKSSDSQSVTAVPLFSSLGSFHKQFPVDEAFLRIFNSLLYCKFQPEDIQVDSR